MLKVSNGDICPKQGRVLSRTGYMLSDILFLVFLVAAMPASVLAGTDKKADPEPVDELVYYDKLADRAYRNRDCEKVELYVGKTMEVRLKIIGKATDEVLSGYARVGKCWKKKGEYTKSLVAYEELMVLCETYYHDNDEIMAAIYSIMGEMLQKDKQYQRSIDMYSQALVYEVVLHGYDHRRIGKTYTEIATSLEELNRKEEAVVYLEKALEVYQNLYRVNHHNVKDITQRILVLQPQHREAIELQNKYKEMELKLQEARERRKKNKSQRKRPRRSRR